MRSQAIGLLVALIIPLGFYFFFANKAIPKRPTIKRLIALPADAAQPNKVKVNDTLWHTIPEFQFMGHNGKPVTKETLKDKIYVANFFFTNCPGICPKVSSQMQRIQREFKLDEEFMLLSHTVDPDRDDVVALSNYADAYEVDSSKWLMVTGEKVDLYQHIRHGYLLPDVRPGNGDEDDFIHSERIVLVDKAGVIRGYYDGTVPAEVNRLMVDIRILKLEYPESFRKEKLQYRVKGS